MVEDRGRWGIETLVGAGAEKAGKGGAADFAEIVDKLFFIRRLLVPLHAPFPQLFHIGIFHIAYSTLVATCREH